MGGPTSDLQQPEVDALKKYVESGGRALIMLEPPLKMGRAEIADNTPLTNLLQSWGVTMDKDLILDLNPIGQLAGLGPEVALVTSYPSQTIVNEMKRTATGFPLARSMQIKNGDKTSVEKLIDSSSSSLATTNLSSPQVNPDDPKNKKGPLTIAAAGTYNTGKENSQGRFVVFGSARWAENSFIGFNGNNDLALNTVNWLASDEDLISIRPKQQEDRRVTMTRSQMRWVHLVQPALPSSRRGHRRQFRCGGGGAATNARTRFGRRRRGAGGAGRLTLLVESSQGGGYIDARRRYGAQDPVSERKRHRENRSEEKGRQGSRSRQEQLREMGYDRAEAAPRRPGCRFQHALDARFPQLRSSGRR